MMAGSCIGLAALIGTFEAAGGSLMGNFATANPVAEARALGLDHDAPSEPDWREQRDERRRKFFKVSSTRLGARDFDTDAVRLFSLARRSDQHKRQSRSERFRQAVHTSSFVSLAIIALRLTEHNTDGTLYIPTSPQVYHVG